MGNDAVTRRRDNAAQRRTFIGGLRVCLEGRTSELVDNATVFILSLPPASSDLDVRPIDEPFKRFCMAMSPSEVVGPDSTRNDAG